MGISEQGAEGLRAGRQPWRADGGSGRICDVQRGGWGRSVNAGAGRERWGRGSRQALKSSAGKRIEDGPLAAGERGQKEVRFRPHDLSRLRPEGGRSGEEEMNQKKRG